MNPSSHSFRESAAHCIARGRISANIISRMSLRAENLIITESAGVMAKPACTSSWQQARKQELNREKKGWADSCPPTRPPACPPGNPNTCADPPACAGCWAGGQVGGQVDKWVDKWVGK